MSARTVITIKNKLEIQHGNVISVPGCEPTSSLTGTSLLKNIDCNASIIPLEDALALIPGSRVVRTLIPAGGAGTGKFFELPEGPPPNGNDCDSCPPDFYAILKENARIKEDEEDGLSLEGDICAGFNFSGTVLEQDPQRTARDPDMRPNMKALAASSEPLSIVDRQGRAGEL